VQEALNAHGLQLDVKEFAESTRTAEDAARAIGCQLGQIVKSLVFKAQRSGKAVLVIASGSNRVDEKIIRDHLGEKIGRADADFVRAQTGFAIGGVPPVGHTQKLTTFIDKDLLDYDEIWAAAGTPNAVFRLTPDELVRIVAGEVIAVN
jgi:prolyl-tRNA editing enzyme YbaK/EbsC (Cys-tRNA(Pro) deacylase)